MTDALENHTIDIRPVVGGEDWSIAPTKPEGYRATCRCGWHGKDRAEQADAENDAILHRAERAYEES